MKSCSKCKIEKPLIEFSKNSQQKSGLNPSCKLCKSLVKKVYYQNNKADIKEKASLWVKNNPEKREVIKKRYTSKPSSKENYWKNSIWYKFKLTPEDYTSILNSQCGVCYLCDKTPEENGKRLGVDHCHTTGDIRGILCDSCNTGLGMFFDNTEVLQKAIGYLQE